MSRLGTEDQSYMEQQIRVKHKCIIIPQPLKTAPKNPHSPCPQQPQLLPLQRGRHHAVQLRLHAAVASHPPAGPPWHPELPRLRPMPGALHLRHAHGDQALLPAALATAAATTAAARQLPVRHGRQPAPPLPQQAFSPAPSLPPPWIAVTAVQLPRQQPACPAPVCSSPGRPPALPAWPPLQLGAHAPHELHLEQPQQQTAVCVYMCVCV
jgi:hypothetical protein